MQALEVFALVEKFRHAIEKHLDDNSLTRIRLMSLDHLDEVDHLDRKLSRIPFHALRYPEMLEEVAEIVAKHIRHVILREQPDTPAALIDSIATHMKSRLVSNIHANYPIIFEKFNIFDAFYPADGRVMRALGMEKAPSFTMADAFQVARDVTREEGETFIAQLSKQHLRTFPEIISTIREGRLISQQEVYRIVESNAAETPGLVDDFKEKFAAFAESCNVEFLKRSGVFPETLHALPKRMRNSWVAHAEASVVALEEIPQFFMACQVELGLQKNNIDFKVDSELRTALPIDLLATVINSKEDQRTSFMAQHILLKAFERLILENHPIQDAIMDIHSRLDFSSMFEKIPADQEDAKTYIFWDEAQNGFVMSNTKPAHDYVVGHEDTAMEGDSQRSFTLGANFRELQYELDWRYVRLNGQYVSHRGKRLRAHIVGRGRKKDDIQLEKMINYSNIEQITDEVRSRLVFEYSTEDMLHDIDPETGEALFEKLHCIAQHVGQRVFRQKETTAQTVEGLDLGEFIVENQLPQRINGKGLPVLWRDLRISGLTKSAASVESQFISWQVYCDELNPQHPMYHFTYKRPRKISSMLEEMPISLFPELHMSGNAILDELETRKEKLVKLYARKK